MNKTFLIGRLTKDPEIRYTTTNQAVCDFNIAIDRPPRQDGTKETDFLNCVVWGKQAENLGKYQKKGSLIAVEGSNRVDQYKNEQGENRYKHYILVSTIQYLTSKKDDMSNNNQISNPNETMQSGTNNDVFEMFGQINQNEDIGINENDLPF